MIHPFVFLLDIVALILFVLTIIKQISLQHTYKNLNGLKYHRLAYIAITSALALNLFFRIILMSCTDKGYFSIDLMSNVDLFLLVLVKICTLIVAIFSYLWFKGSTFKFLKIFDKWL